MSIQQKALAQAVALLRSIGAQFAIIHDGVKHGELEIIHVKAHERKRQPVAFHWANVYNTWLASAKPGAHFRYTCDTEGAANSLRGAIGSQLSRKFGNGGAMTSVTKGETGWIVEALVVSDNTKQEQSA